MHVHVIVFETTACAIILLIMYDHLLVSPDILPGRISMMTLYEQQ